MDASRDAYDELYVYTMGRGGDSFVLQHVVDAFGAQTANAHSKPIGVIFSLAGLYLHVERAYTGRRVQRVHMQLGQRKRQWPAIFLPDDRGSMTAADVLTVPPGVDRDLAIDAWCRTVWAAFRDSRSTIIGLLREYDIT